MFFKYVVLVCVPPVYLCLVVKHNNACKTFIDYYHSEYSKNCYHDPDTKLTTPEIIRKYAGVVEVHNATSQDGYILSLFRIPREDSKGVLLIHHSIAVSSRIYLWQGNDSFALTLWRQGYDVWLANQRGTSYSDRHLHLSSADFRYWNFGVHEMGVYDVPSEIELIRTKTNNSKIIYMGHSLGSGIGLVYASSKPAEAKKYLKSMILLAAPSYLQHVTSGLTLFRQWGPTIKGITDVLRIGSPLAMLSLLVNISRIITRMFPSCLFIVSVLIWIICGYTPQETDPTFWNFDGLVYLNNFSWKTLLHFFQITNAKCGFQMYDYGRRGNLKMYGDEKPPSYAIGNVSVPTLLVSSAEDTLVTLKDSESLFEDLPAEAKVHGHWKLSGLNHCDYLIGKHRREIFVDKLLVFLKTL